MIHFEKWSNLSIEYNMIHLMKNILSNLYLSSILNNYFMRNLQRIDKGMILNMYYSSENIHP